MNFITRSCIAPILLMSLTLSAAAETCALSTGNPCLVPAESCGDLLRLASRDVQSQTQYSDQKKYYYQQICQDNKTGLDFNAVNASGVLGIDYKSQDDYCRTEQSFDSVTRYSREDASIVVRHSLDTYLACRKLEGGGVASEITVPTVENPTVFAISLYRTSVERQTVNDVTIDNDSVECSARSKGNASIALTKRINDINHQFPENKERWTMTCTRKFELDSEKNRTYPQVQLMVATSAGAFPFSLTGTGKAANTWASDLRKNMSEINSRLNGIKLTFRRRAGNPIDTIAEQEKWCPDNDVVNGFRGYKNVLDMFYCVTVDISVPH